MESLAPELPIRVVLFKRLAPDRPCSGHILLGGVDSHLKCPHIFLGGVDSHLKCPHIFLGGADSHLKCPLINFLGGADSHLNCPRSG